MSFFKNLVRGPKTETTDKVSANETSASPRDDQPAAAEESSALKVSLSQILMQQVLTSKDAVLNLISEAMLKHGFVSESYVQALTDRELKVSTYLINGVAIPHGTNEAKTIVKKTGVIIVQVPEGIVWNEQGDVAKFIVGIAAKDTDHLELLQKLTQVVMDRDLAESMGTTTDPNDILRALSMDLAAGQTLQDFTISAEALVFDEAGMHARPASLLSEQAAQFSDTDIRIRNKDVTANAKSMASLLAMGAVKNDTLVVSAEGPKAQEAVDTLSQMINEGLDGDDETSADYNPLAGLPALPDADCERTVKGSAASPGIAIAPIYKLENKQHTVVREADDPEKETQRLHQAFQTAAEQLDELKVKLANKAPKEAAILQAQKQLLTDEVVVQAAEEFIKHRNSAEWSFKEAVQGQIDALEQVDNERLRARIADFVDVRERVLSVLAGASSGPLFPTTDFILLATDLTPSQTAGLEGLPVKAICTELGGPNSHMAILARALGIPALVGLGKNAAADIACETPAIVDAQGSSLYLTPAEATVLKTHEWIAKWQQMRAAEDAQKHEAAQTKDGHTVEVVCNIAKPEDAPNVVEHGGEGVGLLRTEFLFEAAASEPSVDEQMASLKAIVEKIGTRQLVVRTSDIGGDKPVAWMDMPAEDNPFLGIRGIRLSFKHEDIFRRQLEAIYRTAKWQVEQEGATGIHIMFPMIAKLSEWFQAKEIAENVRKNVGAPEVPLGIMVEIPSAAMIADQFAKEVDFFSVGSNDLTQYTLAMDRLHPDLCKEADNYHPAILRLIEMTVRAAEANGKWVGVCGNMAADPNVAALLVGLGVRELSVSPSNVAAVKNIIRSVQFSKLKAKAEKALQMGSSEAVMALYRCHDDLV